MFLFKLQKPSENLCKFHRKTSLLESFFKKVVGLKAYNFIKKETATKVFSREIYKGFLY